MIGSPDINLKKVFTAQAAVTSGTGKKAPTVPLSIRVTEDEKAQLQALAGSLAISAYIRQQLLGDGVVKQRAKRYLKKPRKPSVDSAEVARLLSMFGRSELAQSMLALSLAAQQGTLDVSQDIEERIELACEDIHTIKLALILALGVKPQGVKE